MIGTGSQTLPRIQRGPMIYRGRCVLWTQAASNSGNANEMWFSPKYNADKSTKVERQHEGESNERARAPTIIVRFRFVFSFFLFSVSFVSGLVSVVFRFHIDFVRVGFRFRFAFGLFSVSFVLGFVSAVFRFHFGFLWVWFAFSFGFGLFSVSFRFRFCFRCRFGSVLNPR